jgi:deoxyribose-phosphate aldolase
MELTRAKLAGMIDHTLLSPDATADGIDALCTEAKEHGFKAVCVNPFWVPRVKRALAGSGVLVCTVIGFPLGSNTPEQKASEARMCIMDGADELDMVMNLGAFLSGDTAAVANDIAAVVGAAEGLTVKVIVESGSLDETGLALACIVAADAGATYVKTSTGFGPPCTPAHVILMSEAVGDRVRVKASGGIRTFDDALAMIRAGAHRLGTSSGPAIVAGWKPTEV